jgi:hypothetical protein
MTTYVIGLVVVALVYGLFWNNGSARSYAHGALDADSPPAQPNPPDNLDSKREGATRAGSYPHGAVLPGQGSYPDGAVLPGRGTGPISAGHRSQRSSS